MDNLYAYLDALFHLRSVPGSVVEIGCAHGGTTALACHFLARINSWKEYVCIDTFSGFLPEQLATDHRLGLTNRHDKLFAENSKRQVERNLAAVDIRGHVRLIEADISTIDVAFIPDQISVALLDVDLRDPIFDGLDRLYPRLAAGGVILVDDCKAATSWVGADVGYRDFVEERNLPPRYYMGFGVVVGAGESELLPWEFSSTPWAAGTNFYA